MKENTKRLTNVGEVYLIKNGLKFDLLFTNPHTGRTYFTEAVTLNYGN